MRRLMQFTTFADTTRTNKVKIKRDGVNGRKTINQYEIIEELGRGRRSKVKLARNTETGEKVAIKIVTRRSEKHQLARSTAVVLNEVNILKKIRHDNIITLHEVIDDAEHTEVYLVLEYAEFGPIPWRKKGLPHVCKHERHRIEDEMRLCKSSNLPDHLNFLKNEPYDGARAHDLLTEHYSYVPCITYDQIRRILRDSVLGLESLHEHGVVHRDIKPENLLLSEGYRLKIADFDVSFVRPDGFDNTYEMLKTVGTPGFMAPELCCIGNEIVYPELFEQVDIWSLGVTLYSLVFGRLPFIAESSLQMFHKMAAEDPYIPRQRLRPVPPSKRPFISSTYKYRNEDIIEFEDVDGMLVDLLRRMLCREPAQRIRLESIKHHPWLLHCDDTPGNPLANRTTLQQTEEMEGDSTDGEASIGFAAFW